MTAGTLAAYLSSTREDLLLYRAAVRTQIESMKLRPVVMETENADERPPLSSCVAAVQESAVYIGIFAHRYGFIPPGETRAITELEYRAAGDAGIERLIFLVDHKHPWTLTESDHYTGEGNRGAEITRLREELLLDKTVQFFTTPEDLKGKVAAALHAWYQRYQQQQQQQQQRAVSTVPSLNAYLEDCIAREKEVDEKYVHLSGTGERRILGISGFPLKLIPRVFRLLSAPQPVKVERELLPSIADLLEDYPQVVIVGEPGSGKSTTLRYVHLQTAQMALSSGGVVPIHINLAEWPEKVPDFKSLLLHERELKGCPPVPPSRLLLLLDGLNEVRENRYGARVDSIQKWLDDNPAARMVVTARQQQYLQNAQLHTPIVTIHPLTDEQVELFVQKYLGEQEAEGLLASIGWEQRNAPGRRSLARLADNPFQLALLCFVYVQNRGSLPSTRGELLRILAQTVYQREKELGNDCGLSYEELQAGLGELALSAVQARSATALDEAWAARKTDRVQYAPLRSLGVNTGLLKVSKKNGFIQFAHQLVLEYFAAERLSQQPEKLGPVIGKMRFHGGERRAQAADEVCFTLAELHPDRDAVLAAIAAADPYLAADIALEHGPSVSDSRKQTIAERLVEDRFERGDGTHHAFITRISRLGDAAVAALATFLQKKNKLQRRLAVQALATIDSFAAIQQLAEARNVSDRWVKKEARAALAELGERQPELAEMYVREQITGLDEADQELRELLLISPEPAGTAEPEPIEELIVLPEEPALPEAAVDGSALLEAAKMHIEQRREITREQHERRVAALAAADAKMVAAEPPAAPLPPIGELIALLGEAPPRGADAIIHTLVRHGETAVPALLEGLTTNNPRLRRRIPRVLGHIGDKRALAPVTELVKDRNSDVALHAIRALAELADSSSHPVFVAALSSPEAWIRIFAMRGLLNIEAPNAVTLVLPFLEDEDRTVRAEVVKMLKFHHAPLPVDTIEALLWSSLRAIRHTGMAWLLRRDAVQGIEGIANALRTGDAVDREYAATLLARVIDQVEENQPRSLNAASVLSLTEAGVAHRYLDLRRQQLADLLREIVDNQEINLTVRERCAIALVLLLERERAAAPATTTPALEAGPAPTDTRSPPSTRSGCA